MKVTVHLAKVADRAEQFMGRETSLLRAGIEGILLALVFAVFIGVLFGAAYLVSRGI